MNSRVSLPQALGIAISAYEARQYAEAEGICQQIVSFKPDYFDAAHLLAVVRVAQGKSEQALASYDQALKIQPDHAQALSNRAVTLHALSRYGEALADCDRALKVQPNYPDALNNRAAALQALNRPAEGLTSVDAALALQPAHADAWCSRGNILQDLRRYDEALASYDRAVTLRPGFAQALSNRGNALHALKRHAEALTSYDRALALWPSHADTHFNHGVTLQALRRYDAALASFDSALAAQPTHPYALNGVADCVLRLCDWSRRDTIGQRLIAQVGRPGAVVFPFPLVGYSADPALLRRSAEGFLRDKIPQPPSPMWTGQAYGHDKIRLAYLSADFRNHPIGYLTPELFEGHDRSRFEVIGVSFGEDDASDPRRRIAAAFDEFHDVRGRSDPEIARLLAERQVDIAIDLMGYTDDSRTAILAHRPAPVQVSWLGFPATMGAPFIDYILADPVVLPFEDQPYFSEKIVQLPDCYLVNDSTRQIAEPAPTRAQAGLPDEGFVFCAFNAAWKITPEVFAVWMRLLQQVGGSVLWLRDDGAAGANLRAAAKRAGVDPARLVFAAQAPMDQHLARQRLADLFLDTLPYNAHTTASEALWAGLPVLTCEGATFPGRVAASLLTAVGLPELITESLADYEALALTLAREPQALSGLRERLAKNRQSYPAFDTARFTRSIEAAYEAMLERRNAGRAPEAFAVQAGTDAPV